jgi:hypothetical protein
MAENQKDWAQCAAPNVFDRASDRYNCFIGCPGGSLESGDNSSSTSDHQLMLLVI